MRWQTPLPSPRTRRTRARATAREAAGRARRRRTRRRPAQCLRPPPRGSGRDHRSRCAGAHHAATVQCAHPVRPGPRSGRAGRRRAREPPGSGPGVRGGAGGDRRVVSPRPGRGQGATSTLPSAVSAGRRSGRDPPGDPGCRRNRQRVGQPARHRGHGARRTCNRGPAGRLRRRAARIRDRRPTRGRADVGGAIRRAIRPQRTRPRRRPPARPGPGGRRHRRDRGHRALSLRGTSRSSDPGLRDRRGRSAVWIRHLAAGGAGRLAEYPRRTR